MRKQIYTLLIAVLAACFMLGFSLVASAVVDDPHTPAEAEWRKEGELVGQGSLQSALEAAQEGDADEVKLLQAIEGVEASYSISRGSFTVDINGQSLSSYKASFFTVAGPAEVIFKDSVGGGKILGEREDSSASCAPIIVRSSGSVTVESGTYEGYYAIESYQGIEENYITLRGGHFIGNGSAAIKVDECSLAIEGGTLEGGSNGVIEMSDSTLALRGGALTGLEDAPNGAHIYYFSGTVDISEYPSAVGLTVRVSSQTNAEGFSLPENCVLTDENGNIANELTTNKIYRVGVYCTVSFAAGEGSGEMEDVFVISGHTLTLPTCTFTAPPQKIFSGWGVGSDLRQPGETVTISADTQLIAYYADGVKVSFDGGGAEGEMEDVYALPQSQYTLPECGFTAPEGNVFLYWINHVGGIYEVGDELNISNGMHFTAVWGDVCAVSFDAGYETSETMEDILVVPNNSVRLPACSFTAPEGKGFFGWLLNGATYGVGDYIYVTEDTSLVAVWSTVVTVAPVPDNGTNETMAPIVGLEGESITLPVCEFTAPEGKGFFGWLVGNEILAPHESVLLSVDMTVTAVWKPYVTVTFAPGDAEGEMEADQVLLESYYMLPECDFSMPDGMRFDSWQVSDGTSVYQYEEGRIIRVSGALTVTPILREIITITLLPGYDEGSFAPRVVPFEGELLLPPTIPYPAPEGKIFAGWMIDGTFYEPYALYNVTKSVTLTAVWKDAAAIEEWDGALRVGGVLMQDGDYLAVGQSAVTRVKPDGGYAYYKDGVLTLKDYTYTGFGFCINEEYGEFALIATEDSIELLLIGESRLAILHSIPAMSTSAIYSDGEVVIGGEGKLSIEAYDGILADSLQIESGTLVIEQAEYALNVWDFTMQGGTLLVEDTRSAISAGNVYIRGGRLTLYAYEDAIYCDDDLTVLGGEIYIYSGDDGIYADGDVMIRGGSLYIAAADTGVLAYNLTVGGGDITVHSNGYGFDVYENTYIFDGHLWIRSYDCAIYTLYLEIGGKAELTLCSTDAPALLASDLEILGMEHDGYVGYFEPYKTILYANGDPAYEVELAPYEAENPAVYVGGIRLTDGDYLASGSFVPTRVKPENGGYAYYKDGVLTLSGYTYEGDGYIDLIEVNSALIYTESDLEIVLVGENTLTAAKGAYGVVATSYAGLTLSGEGSLSITAYEGIRASQITVLGGTYEIDAEDDGIYADTLTVRGGSFRIAAETDDAIDGEYIEILDGAFELTAVNNGIEGENVSIEGGSFLINGKDDALDASRLTVYGGTFTLTAEDDGADADVITVYGGTFTVDAQETGFTAESLLIKGGSFVIRGGENGLYHYQAKIYGGDFVIVAGEVGIDVTYLYLHGGNLHVSVTDEEIGVAVWFYELSLRGVKIYTPADAEHIEHAEGGYEIGDASGNIAKTVFITGDSHVFGDVFVHTDTHHFKACTEGNCTLPADGSMHKYIAEAAYGAHTPGAAASCAEAQKCTACEKELVAALGHTAGAAATCTEAQKCTVCGETLAAALGHSYDNACDGECNVCKAARDPAAHTDADGNELCDACGAAVPKKGLSTGAIVGISVGSAAVAGAGGFSLFWFVIKKKKPSDLLSVFKK